MEYKNPNKYGALNSEELTSAVSKLKLIMPKDYQEYLLDHNGGTPIPNDFNISRTEGLSSIHVLYGLNQGPDRQHVLRMKLLFKDRMPACALPVGSDDSGNQIIISCGDKDQGSVWFWDHEQESDQTDDWSNMTKIADSCTEFVAALFEYIDPEDTKWDNIIRNRDAKLLQEYIDSGTDLELRDIYERTLIENCAISGANEFISTLYGAGAALGESLKYAEKNAQYFEEHKETVKLIRSLM